MKKAGHKSQRPAVFTNDRLLSRRRFAHMDKAEKELAGIYGRRYIDYRRHFKLSGALKYKPPFPIYLMLEQTYRCNLRCPSCIHAYPDLRKRYDLGVSCMPWDMYKKIILEGEEHGCPSMAVMNNDEPLLIRDLAERISYARGHGFMDVIMTTNGNLFTERSIKAVMDAGVTRILFSIDAATEKTYGKVRPGGDMKKVLWAMGQILAYRKERKTNLPILRASFVPSAINQHEVNPFLEKFSGLADYVDIQPFWSYYFVNSDMIPDDTVPIKAFHCNQSWRNLIVRGNGDVLGCCAYYGTELVVGHLRWNSLYEIFNFGLMKQLRQEAKDGVYRNPACRACAETLYRVKT